MRLPESYCQVLLRSSMCETSHINSRNLLDFPFSIRQVVSKFHIWWVGWYFIIRKINSGIKPVKTDFCFMCCFNKELKSIPLVIFPIKTQMFPLYWAFARSEKVLGNSAPSQFALWKKKETKQKLTLRKSTSDHPLYHDSQCIRMNHEDPWKLCMPH